MTVESSRSVPLPLLPLKNTVLFPNLFVPLTVNRKRTLAAVEAALKTEEKFILTVMQKDASVEHPTDSDLFPVGTRAVIRKVVRGEGPGETTINLLVQGVERVHLLGSEHRDPYFKTYFRPFPHEKGNPIEVEALKRALTDLSAKVLQLTMHQQETPNLEQWVEQMGRSEDPLPMAYLLATLLSLDGAKQQSILEAPTTEETLRILHEAMNQEVQILQVRKKIAETTKTELDKQQREFVLRQQLEAIQKELGEATPEKAQSEELRKRFEEAHLPGDVRKEAERELSRLEKMPSIAPDYQMTRTYLELLLDLPWEKHSESSIDLERAKKVLDEDHFDLQDIKDRILEQLAVLKLNPKAKAPILCLVGPPGVGKTSLGQSISRALGRKFEHMSLGGLHDEAELRGHRRTYIGAMPGRILQAMRRASVNNPLLMLDEIDKIGHDFRGDPAAALLEILDPAQNHAFRDNYLDLPFDLSRVFFITTANTADTIPGPLLDRMEVLRLSGYTEEEKVQIARRYLIPRRIAEAGLTDEKLKLSDETLRATISRYTREAGVRDLERAIGRIASKCARGFAEGRTESYFVKPDDLRELLGPERARPEAARIELASGVAAGLAWTPTGGEILYIEASLLPGSTELRLTGQLGEVMRESAKAAQTYLWAHAKQFGIDTQAFRESGLHVHVPAGAIPKDGPSAGVAIVSALASAFTGIPCRNDTAMTGEITLSGLILPVGGIKEKVLAASRAGLSRVILPKDNASDLSQLPPEIREKMKFILAERIEAVLPEALTEALPYVEERLASVAS